MTSETSQPPTPAGSDLYRAFFESLEVPTALCDPRLRPLAVNPAFHRLCTEHDTHPEALLEAVGPQRVPGEGEVREVEVCPPGAQPVALVLSHKGGVVAVQSWPEPAGGRLVLAERALLEQARTEGVLLDLGRSVAEAAGEEELVAAVARGVKELFPGRSFCIRIIDVRTGVLTSLYAEGRLRQGAKEPLVLKRSALEKTHLPLKAIPSTHVEVAASVPLIFEGSVRGLSAPLVASAQLFGGINLEYPEGLQADMVHDERVLVQLANQVAVAVKNAKLIDELTFVRKYLEELLEKANALILVANRDKRVVVFNQALSVLTGFSKAQVLGQDLLGFVPEDEHMRLLPVLAATMRGEPVQNFELRLRTRTGEARASFATSTVLTPQGEVEGVMAIGQDVTVMKELERRIIHTEKLASLGQLAASVAHEINNPMTAVVSYADALLQRALTQVPVQSGDVEKLKRILESSHRILRFTRDLVSYARPAKDRPERVQLNAVLDSAVGFCEHVLAQARATLERDYAELPPLSAVRANLVQVFVNLITNACHALQPGGRVYLTTRREGQEAVVWVRDTGSGIEPQHLSRIFEPFFTTKPEGKGTGLGLSIVQGIIEKHGGRLGVESELGKGTTFVIHLPLAE